ncbi:MAG: ferritin [Bacteroidales bacterium]|nr:ferritin [Bacteroidales bacterium]
MITTKLQKAINDQITAELWSSQLYLQMAYFLKSKGWDGFSHWMQLQALEEREHATRMADYMTDRGGIVRFQMIDVVPEGWGSVLEIFEHAYSHECKVSKMIDNIVKLSQEENDYATENFYRTFVDEQVEEEATASGIVDKLKKAGDSGIFFLDSELGKRKD